jgi:hypothetical protein
MKLTNQSGGSAPRKIKGAAKAGCENPASAAHVDVGIPHKVSMPVAAMAGSFARKIPGPEKAGQAVAGEAKHASQSFVRGKKLTKSSGGKGPKL